MKRFNPLLVCVFGASGAGKDEFVKICTEYSGYNRLHPIEDLKIFLEDHFAISRGSLDRQDGKNHKPLPGLDVTMQDIMVQLYHFWERLGVPFSYFYVKQVLERGEPLVVLAIRNEHEYQAILDNADMYTIAVVKITRPGCKEISTDHLQNSIFERLSEIATEVIELNNGGTLEEWHDVCYHTSRVLKSTYDN